MRSSRRLISQASAALSFLAAFGCMEPMEPTPDSAPVTITPQTESVFVTDLASGWTFTLPLLVRNTGSRTVFVDLVYRRTEKLIDQRWQFAQGSQTGQRRAILPFQTLSLSYVVTYVNGTYVRGTMSELLEHARGLYRVGLRLSYDANESAPLPEQNYYSRSFVVVTE